MREEFHINDAEGSDYDERYELVEPANRLLDTSNLCYKILDFLLDMPYRKKDGTLSTPHEHGARADLIKYIYYDTANPLICELPTVEQKRNLIFNPGKAQNPPNIEKGYRIFAQPKVIDIQTNSETSLRIYPYMINPLSSQSVEFLVNIDCWSNIEYNQLSSFECRTYNMAKCVVNALNGRNITGIGGMYCDKRRSSYCGIGVISDNKYNQGYRIIMGVNMESALNNFRNA